MSDQKPGTGAVHDPGVVSAEDPTTGEPDPSVLKHVSEQQSMGNEAPAEALAADTARRRSLQSASEAQPAETKWQKRHS